MIQVELCLFNGGQKKTPPTVPETNSNSRMKITPLKINMEPENHLLKRKLIF